MGFIKRKCRQISCWLKYPQARQPAKTLCKILKSHEEIETCTRFLHWQGLESHSIPFKDWDLATIIPEIRDGNFLDMGSSDSYVLQNLLLKKFPGELHGIDLRKPNHPLRGVQYEMGNLINTNYPDRYFKNIACLSVIEHGVDITQFAKETSRLLEVGGKLFVTFDYWDPKITSHVKLFGLDWQPFDKKAVVALIAVCKQAGLFPVQEMDWTTGRALVNKDNYSPDPAVSYTFGIVTLEKRDSRAI